MRLKLLTSFTLTTSVLLLGAMVLLACINLGTLRELWLQEAIRDVDNLSETIVRTTYYQMLEDDRDLVYQMIRDVGDQEGIEHIRLVNKDGAISFSTEEGEIGVLLDKNAEACSVCHFTDTPLAQSSFMNRSRIFRDHNGRQILGLAKGIYNQPRCYTAPCHAHPADAKLLGVLDVTVSLEEMHSRIAAYRNTLAAFTGLMLVALCGCLAFLMRKYVTRPVTQLLEQTRHLASGELDGCIEAVPANELGELAAAFNEMTVNLRRAQDELRECARTLETKVEERTLEIQEIQARLVHSEKLVSLGELVAGIAHEVNNPLTGIMVFTSMVLSNPRLDPALREDLLTVTRETQRCADIVKGLLEFARQSAPQKKPDSLSRLLDATLALVEHQAAFHNIRIERHYDPRLPEILVDPAQLRQVFMNMALNAGQAMPEGGVLSVATGRVAGEETLFVRISDTGCGIRPERLSKVFDPFFSTREKGTGLGLSVSYGIVRRHGGEITVKSEAGQGTAFTILLPMRPAEEAGDG